MRSKFWEGKKVFITGHTGFKGSWLSLWLSHLGAHVTGYALNPQTKKNLFEIADIKNEVHSIIGDVCDLEFLSHSLKKAQPDIVIHMAAQALVLESYLNPVKTYSTNVMGTVNILEAVRYTPSVRAVVNITSDKCYENKEWYWGYRETDTIGGYDPYSSSKGCSEIITAAWRSSYFNPQNYDTHRVSLASARAGNVIGGGDWSINRLVPDIINAMIENKIICIRNPNSIRPWQHVLEPLNGYILLAEKLLTQNRNFAESWNFGPRDSDAIPVIALVQKLIDLWDSDSKLELEIARQPQLHEANHLKLDCSKAFKELNWLPKTNLDWALEKTISWHKAYLNGSDMRAATISQIEDFMKI